MDWATKHFTRCKRRIAWTMLFKIGRHPEGRDRDQIQSKIDLFENRNIISCLVAFWASILMTSPEVGSLLFGEKNFHDHFYKMGHRFDDGCFETDAHNVGAVSRQPFHFCGRYHLCTIRRRTSDWNGVLLSGGSPGRRSLFQATRRSSSAIGLPQENARGPTRMPGARAIGCARWSFAAGVAGHTLQIVGPRRLAGESIRKPFAQTI
jgi:hypothetical protein